VSIDLTPKARRWLAEKGYDPLFGARPLRRTLQREVESPLSRKLLKGEFCEVGGITVDVEEDHLVFHPLNRAECMPQELLLQVEPATNG
jgi:ATP-dependent Clp protease ATP-binding subunit ClpA